MNAQISSKNLNTTFPPFMSNHIDYNKIIIVSVGGHIGFETQYISYFNREWYESIGLLKAFRLSTNNTYLLWILLSFCNLCKTVA